MQVTCSNSLEAGHLIVRSSALKRVLKLAEQVARHPAAVLIQGETGTGKEMIARTIHDSSLRRHGPFVDVNCAAFPEHLVESELFGYERGAFSGADAQKPGLFELANKGTLFLDEIGDLSMKVQVKLLRVLDGVPYYRLGGSRKVSPDVRIVAATNQDLHKLVQSGHFRRDLFHRLAQLKVEVPPLRERPEDILGIAEHGLQQIHPAAHFSKDAINALHSYAWPGNVRELKSVIFNAAIHANTPHGEITAADLQLPGGSSPAPTGGNLDEIEREAIFQALERFGGNQNRAALWLGISRRTLVRRLKLYRESGDVPPQGDQGHAQRLHYRAHVRIPVWIKHGHQQFSGQLVNISIGGAAVAVEMPLPFGTRVSLSFAIPETDIAAELLGHVVWSAETGQHGIRFIQVPSALNASLRNWLLSQMEKNKRKLGDLAG
ncbi:MAG: sigma 54-interacting transcriptional regulator [Acidobacteriia bacterium]|nr:sigma 54-interacting transcriptional regulator [Terriglobia bacterium]